MNAVGYTSTQAVPSDAAATNVKLSTGTSTHTNVTSNSKHTRGMRRRRRSKVSINPPLVSWIKRQQTVRQNDCKLLGRVRLLPLMLMFPFVSALFR